MVEPPGPGDVANVEGGVVRNSSIIKNCDSGVLKKPASPGADWKVSTKCAWRVPSASNCNCAESNDPVASAKSSAAPVAPVLANDNPAGVELDAPSLFPGSAIIVMSRLWNVLTPAIRSKFAAMLKYRPYEPLAPAVPFRPGVETTAPPWSNCRTRRVKNSGNAPTPPGG